MDPTLNFGIIEGDQKRRRLKWNVPGSNATKHDFTQLIRFWYLARMRYKFIICIHASTTTTSKECPSIHSIHIPVTATHQSVLWIYSYLVKLEV